MDEIYLFEHRFCMDTDIGMKTKHRIFTISSTTLISNL
jgi:hypothetical protein